MKVYLAILVIGQLVFCAGCTPTVRVTKNPDACDRGIRYYRPKPYLFLSPAGQTVTSTLDESGKATKLVTNVSDRNVVMQLQYLPDFSEEYSIGVSPGIGVAEVSVTLADGWNLTAINQKLDSKIPETIAALGSLSGAVVSGIRKSASDVADAVAGQQVVMAATDIPLGYYESVISRGPDGCKRLYGWRYVGFMPFNGCPTEACGLDWHDCSSHAIYGLAFQDGVMRFRQLGEIQQAGQNPPEFVLVPVTANGTGKPSGEPTISEQESSLENTIKEELNKKTIADIELKDHVKKVDVTLGDSPSCTVVLTLEQDKFKSLSEKVKKFVESLDVVKRQTPSLKVSVTRDQKQ